MWSRLASSSSGETRASSPPSLSEESPTGVQPQAVREQPRCAATRKKPALRSRTVCYDILEIITGAELGEFRIKRGYFITDTES